MARRLLPVAWSVLPFLAGFCIGFISSIPPFGPGALLVIRRGLEGRLSDGFAAAAGGALADAVYCALAVVGFSYLLARHPNIANAMRWGGVAILIGLGVWFFTRDPVTAEANQEQRNGGGRAAHAILGFSLTAFNPTLVITWTTAVAMIASLNGVFFAASARYAFPIGVALGDVAWAGIALLLFRRIGGYLPDRTLKVVMRSIGLLFLALAVFFAIKTIFFA